MFDTHAIGTRRRDHRRRTPGGARAPERLGTWKAASMLSPRNRVQNHRRRER